MAVDAMVPIGSTTLLTTQATFTFSALPTIYKDIFIVAHVRSTYSSDANDDLKIQFNSDAGTNYPAIIAFGHPSSKGSFTVTETAARVGQVATSFSSNVAPSVHTINIFDSTATDKQKAILARSADTLSVVSMIAARWTGTAAITSITFVLGRAGAQLAAGSRFDIYGIRG